MVSNFIPVQFKMRELWECPQQEEQ